MMILPSACASVSRDSFCAVYEPVYTAAEDTELTRAAVDRNNAVWLEKCSP
jgi:hypothetical protein